MKLRIAWQKKLPLSACSLPPFLTSHACVRAGVWFYPMRSLMAQRPFSGALVHTPMTFDEL
jgi:hypothetical protein